MEKEKIKDFVKQLTLEEKAGLTSGADGWFTKAVERLHIPAVRTSDGPVGLRKVVNIAPDQLGGESEKAVCFPTSCTTASSFDRELLKELGETLGRESQAQGVDVLLGPGVNMKRSPLCGRNFEYISEDPYLAGELAAQYVKGVQSQGVGTSLKHFYANNQETRRMDVSVEMDERTMREIYLPAFEKVVKEAKPWTIMASYNKEDGVYSTANKEALDGILRKEWGYEGIVISDWGATHDRVKAVEAGCDLTMPAEDTDQKIVEAVQGGVLSEDALDLCCERLLGLVFRCAESRKQGVEFDYEGDHEKAARMAAESMVLLKNEDGILPLSKEESLEKSVAFIGAFAKEPRRQGGGSAHVNAYKVVGAVSAAKDEDLLFAYAEGYQEDGSTTDELVREAVHLAGEVETAVIFAGLPESMETEGVDRAHMRMPEGHNRLIRAVCEANPNTVVILHNGSPVEMPWIEKPKAVLEAYLGGEAVGEAELKVLFGEVNPSGHLAETFPKKLSDNPSYLSFPGEGGITRYQEGIFTGYRYYETKEMEVLFPFGWGLSYTDFSFRDLKVETEGMEDEGNNGENKTEAKVTVTVTNTGDREGKAVVQLYVSPCRGEIIRPVRELKGFEKVSLQPGESKEVTILLDRRAFSHWNQYLHKWAVEEGEYRIEIGENVHDIVLSAPVKITGDVIPPVGGYTESTPMSVFAKTEKGRVFLDENIGHMVRGMAHLGYIPKELLPALDQMSGGITLDAIDMLAERAGSAGGQMGGTGGLEALLGQSVAILKGFLPEEKKEELVKLVEELNR